MKSERIKMIVCVPHEVYQSKRLIAAMASLRDDDTMSHCSACHNPTGAPSITAFDIIKVG